MTIIWIRNNHYEQIIKDVHECLPYETGGILLGYTDVQGNLVVTKVVGPGPNAVHQEDYFLPDGAYQQDEINNAFRASAGETTYLGDWHSHPYQRPYISNLDFNTLKRIALHTSTGTEEPIFLIMGTHPLTSKCWKFNSANKKPDEIKILLFYS